ncbi:hypothetical protein A2960_03560 [Candidatus Gottesmanbacteria bacterium RIFCSPLOWO2_01_FULL_39_12b]|uniref:DUF3048 domain-containing protein n=1 Tax=Candidatus Gottesmanbacteria bacterium RIFCSPLOWO2_01_FULL_39_12b TaxID=1798388 RepID=A0A1F6ANU9_9BACT|nr:MAG: hypothetical protein A2960_03560 [Candidatus Gottesmanbacteria bacterium RIFCSPLOWO2_01_FULL_39_12b]
MKRNPTLILAGVGLYLITTGISYAVFNQQLPSSNSAIVSPVAKVSPSGKAKFKVDPSLPKNQTCPLNGVKFTEQEKKVLDTRRPLAVMIENSEDARPHSGISRADIVYETLAEGWITRFMAVFYCNTAFENITIAPVRSARTYFLDWVSEYDALYNHVGGSNRIGENANLTDPRANALGQIDEYGIKDLDQFGISYPDCYRNPDRLTHPVATEHTMVCFSDNLYRIAEKREWTNVDQKGIPWDKNFKKWTFKDEPVEGGKGNVNSVKIVFAQGYDKYDVLWEYDNVNNIYKRKNGGVPHFDMEENEQLSAKNVVIQLTKLTGPVDQNGHFLYGTIASGKAIIFQDGKALVGTWSKKSRTGRTQYFGSNGNEIEFTRGPIWIEIVATEQQVTY